MLFRAGAYSGGDSRGYLFYEEAEFLGGSQDQRTRLIRCDDVERQSRMRNGSIRSSFARCTLYPR